MPAPSAALVVFARAPRQGTVKTRLAASLGDDRALAIYRALCEQTIAVARAAGLPVTVAFTPPDAGAEMRAWLGDDLRYEAQCAGDLGERMDEMIERQLRGGVGRVVVIGTDCPAITTDTIHTALSALDDADVAIGPATDGGYYLVATRGSQSAIFREIPWSSASTLAVTLDRAADAGLRVALLAVLADIDTAEDWQEHQTAPR